MSDENSTYTPPRVWTWNTESGGRFAKINRPIAGATSEKELPVGKHDLQLYSLATPNGGKATVRAYQRHKERNVTAHQLRRA